MMNADLTSIFSALADPTRRAILHRLSQGEAPVKDLAEPFNLSGPAITKHLKVLERAGLISRAREGQLRPCKLEPAALVPAADWIEQYRQMWEDQFDRLGDYLQTLTEATPAAAQPETPEQTTRKPRPSRRKTKTGTP